MRMSMLEKIVMNVWGGVPRFGRVIEEKTENKWRFVKVEWANDEAYEMDRERVLNLRNQTKNEKYEWYRSDKVRVINPSRLIETLSEL
jgi:hypothetical protein